MPITHEEMIKLNAYRYDDIPYRDNAAPIIRQYKFSIVFPTYRPGSMDLLFTSLSKQTYKNFELILVDDYPQRTNNKQDFYNNLLNNEKPKYLKFHDPPSLAALICCIILHQDRLLYLPVSRVHHHILLSTYLCQCIVYGRF